MATLRKRCQSRGNRRNPHNPKVAGSNPAPATTQKARKLAVSGPSSLFAEMVDLPGCLPAGAAIALFPGVGSVDGSTGWGG